MATDSILKADKRRQIEELDLQINKEERIKQKANELLDSYKDQLDSRVFKYAKEEVENSGKEKEEQKQKIEAKERPRLKEGQKSPQTTTVIRKKVVKKRKLEN